MKRKAAAGGLAASFFINLLAMAAAVVPVMALSGGSYAFLTGWEQSAWFQELFALTDNFLLFTTLSAGLTLVWAGAAGAMAWLYIRRFTAHASSAIFGSLLYTFSGCGLLLEGHQPWSAVFGVLPLVLWGLEKLLQEGRKGWLALGAALLALASGGDLVLLAGVLLLILGYSLCRIGALRPSLGRVAFSLGEWMLGLCMGAFLLLPALLGLGEFFLGVSAPWKALAGSLPGGSGWGTILARLEEIFFPPLYDARGGLSAISLWLPVLGWGGGTALLACKKHPLRWPSAYAMVLLLLPLGCSLAGLVSLETFGGWLALPVLLLAAAAASALDGAPRSLRTGYAVWLGLTALLCLGLSAGYALSVVGLNSRMLAWYIGGAVLSGGVGILVSCLPERKKLAVASTALLCGAVGAVGFAVSWQALPQVYEYSPYTAAAMSSFLDADKSRMELPSGYGFLEESWQRPVLCLTGEERELAMRGALSQLGAYEEGGDDYALRNLLSSRWKFVFAGQKVGLTGYEYYGSCGSWQVYQNLYSLPYGVVYDTYLPQELLEQAAPEDKAKLALKGLALSEEDYEKVKDLLTPVEQEVLLQLDETSVLTDCYQLAQRSVSGFEQTEKGFVAYSAFEEPGVAFFSVPYSQDYRCYVNGEEIPLLRANGGFMAALIPAGDREIVVEKTQSAALTGWSISLAAAILWLLLRLWDCWKNRTAVPILEELPKEEEAAAPKEKKAKGKKPPVLEELLDVPMEEVPSQSDPVKEQKTASQEPLAAVPLPEEEAKPVTPSPTEGKKEMSLEEMRQELARRRQKNQEEYQKLLEQQKDR